MRLNPALDESIVHNQVKYNGFYNIFFLNTETNIYSYALARYVRASTGNRSVNFL